MKNFASLAAALMISASAYSASPDMSPASHEMHMAMKSMCENMDKMPMSGDINQEFVQMMIPHHQAAVEMAQAYLKEGSDPQIMAMAQNIIEAQKKEIEEMKTWLKGHESSSSASAL